MNYNNPKENKEKLLVEDLPRSTSVVKNQVSLLERDLPLNSAQFFNETAFTIDTREIYEIHQVFTFKESISHSNDYICVILRVKNFELIDFFGGEYLFQIWKNKDRLYQHVHASPVESIYCSKTELVYLLQGEDQFIYLIRPYIPMFTKILCPFPISVDTALFVNDQVLMVTKGNVLKSVKLPEILSNAHKYPYFVEMASFDDFSAEDQFENLLDKQGDLSNSRQTRAAGGRVIARETNQFLTQNSLKRDDFTFEKPTTGQKEQGHIMPKEIKFGVLDIPKDLKILAIDYDINGGHQVMLFAASLSKKLIIRYFELDYQETIIPRLVFKQEYKFSEYQDEYIKMHIQKISNSQFLIALVTREGFCDFLINMDQQKMVSSRSFLSIKDQKEFAYFRDVWLGTDAVYFVTRDGNNRQFKLDSYSDQIRLSYSEESQGFMVSILKERFIKQHLEIYKDMKVLNSVVLLCHGKVLSLYELTTQKWTHFFSRMKDLSKNKAATENYFKRQENEIKSANFMNINKNQIYDILVEHQGNYLLKLVYYSQKNVIKTNKQIFQFDNKSIQKVMMQGSYEMYKDHGESDLSIFFQVRDDQDETKTDIYMSNKESLIIQIVNDISEKMQLITVLNCPTHTLMMANKQDRCLYIYEYHDITAVMQEEDFQERLVLKIENFRYQENQTYYMDQNNLYYQQDGNLIEIDTLTGKRKVFDFGNNIRQLLVIEGRSVYYKDQNELVYFVDLDWIFNKESVALTSEGGMTGASNTKFSEVLMRTSFMECQSLIMSRFEYDVINSKIATFQNPWIIKVFPPLNYNKFECVGSHDFKQNYLAYNILSNGDSQYKAALAAFDHQSNQIKMWSLGTGKQLSSVGLVGLDYKDFRFHNKWEDASLIYKALPVPAAQASSISNLKPAQVLYQWKKIVVTEINIKVLITFKFEYQPGSQYYVGSDNTLMLQYKANEQILYHLRDGGSQIYPITRLDLFYSTVKAPIYFSPDFRTYLDKDYINKTLQVYQIPQQGQAGQLSLSKPEVIICPTTPLLSRLVDQSKNKQPLVHLESNDRITYLNNANVQQSFPLNNESQEDRRLIYESSFEGDALTRKIQSNIQNISDNFLSSLDYSSAFWFKVDQYRAKILNQGKTERFNNNLFQCYVKNNMRIISSFSFYHWKMIELLETDALDINEINPEILQELLNVILPNGDSMLHRLLINNNVKQFDKLMQIIQKERKERKQDYKIHCMPNIKGQTPLHLCAKNSYSKAAESILVEIGAYPLDDHINFIKDTFGDLIQLCPLAFGDYLDNRIINPSWSISYTKGDLIKPDDDCNFNVVPLQLQFDDPEYISSQLFEVDEVNEVNMPMVLNVADIPDLHFYQDPLSINFLKQLARTDVESLYSRQYIQALLELKWPLINRAILIYQFFPYVLYVLIFMFYSLYIAYLYNESQDDHTIKVTYYTLQGLLVVFTMYFVKNEYVQYQMSEDRLSFFLDVWNQIDIIPLVLLLTSIVLSYVAPGPVANVLNAISSFFLWLKFLYFFRIFRRTGHLIKMIMEVIYDIRFFLIVLVFTIFAFSGSFYMISDPADMPSFIRANTYIYEVMLGSFDTTKFDSQNTLLLWILFLIATMFLIIIMLNLLIAIISDTFERVQGSQKQRMYQEFASLIYENTHLLSKRSIEEYDKRGKYLYIASVETSENDQGDVWEGKITAIKNMIALRTDNLQNLIEQNYIAFRDSQANIDKQFNSLTVQTETNVSTMNLRVNDISTRLDQTLGVLDEVKNNQVQLIREMRKITASNQAIAQNTQRK